MSDIQTRRPTIVAKLLPLAVAKIDVPFICLQKTSSTLSLTIIAIMSGNGITSSIQAGGVSVMTNEPGNVAGLQTGFYCIL